MVPPTGGDDRPLCDRCRLLLSTENLSHRGRFRHSLLSSFSSRPDCRLCHYLWNANWGGTSNTPRSVYRLRDLLEMRPNAARLQHSGRFQASWVVCGFYLSIKPTALAALPDPSNQDIDFDWDPASETFHFHPVQGTHLAMDSFNIVLRVRLEDDSGRMLWSSFSGLDLVTTDDSPCAKITSLRHMEWSGPITGWMPSLRTLLADCHAAHDRCQPIQPTLLPARLLRVQTNQAALSQVVLRVTPRDEDHGLYAALSYCWGGPQKLKLITSNFAALQQGIDAASLPQTLQDAVLVTQLLGLEYLWVDALCIIQDDDADKAVQLAQMHTIYENSAVTIAAGAASSVEQGFLSFQSAPSDAYPSLDVAMRFSDGALGRLSLVPSRYHAPQNFPINKRGWTLQEAIIPPRLLVFGDLEPFLRCRTKDFISVAGSPVRYLATSMEPQRFFSDTEDNTWTRLDRFQNAWPEIVQQYTKRELGFIQDRPIAIGGVTDYLAAIFGDTCYYGVWKARALECLLWKVTHGGGRTSGYVPDNPSWSWMAVVGIVDLDNMTHMRAPEAVVDWGDDPADGELGVECRVVPLADIAARDLIESWPDTIADDPGTDAYVEIDNTCWGDGDGLFALVMCHAVNNHVLALVAVRHEDGAYGRVGMVELRGVPSLLQRPRSKIALV